MSRTISLIALTVVGIWAFAPTPLANKNFKPDWTLTSLAQTEQVGDASWTLANGELRGTPKAPGGGWLLLEPALQDVQFGASFQCAAGCQAGFLLRAEKASDGYKGVFVSIGETAGAFAVTLDARGQIQTREPIPGGGGTVRFLQDAAQGGGARAGGGAGPAAGAGRGGTAPGAAPGPGAAAAGQAAGAPPVGAPAARGAGAGAPAAGRGGGGGARGALPADAPYTRPTYTFQPGEWNTLESILDANILRSWLNDGPEGGVASGRVDDGVARRGRIGLYVGGTSDVRYRLVEAKDLARRDSSAEQVGARFRMQRLNEHYYSWSATAADVNRDGVLDVLSGPYYFLGPSYLTQREIYLSNTFNPSTQYASGACNLAFDYTGDGYPDYLVTEGRNFVMYVNPGAEPRRWDRYPALSNNSEVAAFADVNGDGAPDVVSLTGGMVSYASVNRANPTSPWTVTNVSGPGYTVVAQHGIGAGDINGDGRVDLLSPYGWWEQPAAAASGPWSYHPVAFGRWPRAGASPGGAELRVADLNGDKLNDVVTSLEAHGWGLAWYEQQRSAAGQISWRQHIIMDGPSAKNPGGVSFSELHALTTADIDGDGVQDIVTGKRMFAHLDSYNDPDPFGEPVLYVFRTVRNKNAPGGAEFVPELVHNRSGVGSMVQSADINKDGAQDILTATNRGTFVFFGAPRRR